MTSWSDVGNQVGGGQARELRELVHQVLERVHLLDDGLAALGQDLLEARGRLDVGLADPLGRELDGGERVLDLVGELPRHLAPGRDLLGAHQRGEVVEHEHHPGRRAQRAPGSGTTVAARWR